MRRRKTLHQAPRSPFGGLLKKPRVRRSRLLPSAKEMSPECMRSCWILPMIESIFATTPSRGEALRKERYARPSGWWARRDFSISRMCGGNYRQAVAWSSVFLLTREYPATHDSHFRDIFIPCNYVDAALR